MYLVTAEEMREMDRRTIESFGIPGQVLMEAAGRGATRFFLETLAPRGRRTPIAVAAGRGNNGGDGFVMARYLSQLGHSVTVYLLAKSNTVTGDAALNLALLRPLKVPLKELPDPKAFKAHKMEMRHQGVWVDAILGTGLTSDVRDYYRDVIEFINALKKPVFSVDIPSGLSSETGQPCGISIQADATATFAFPKIGHLLYPGAALTGSLKVVDIGIPPDIASAIAPHQDLLTPDRIRRWVPPRPPDAHKGHTGHVLIVAGSPGKTGAAAMTAMSAVRTGAGLVTLAVPESLNPILETQVLEAMTLPVPETSDGVLSKSCLKILLAQMADKKCLALGPGIGTSDKTIDLVQELLRKATIPVVVDADGLNCIAEDTGVLKQLSVPVVLTPHPGEMSRLSGATTTAIQQDRIGSARKFAESFNVHVVLKGARTVIADPDGQVSVNPTGNAGMASGGMGDVLTGVIAGLVAQGVSPADAARCGAYLHGMAADALSLDIGPVGYTAGDVMTALPGQITRIMASPPETADGWPLTAV